MMQISATDLERLVSKCFATHGLSDKDANRIAELLVEGEMKGKRHHGVVLTETYIKRIGEKKYDPVVEWDTGAFLRIDGGDGLGPLVADRTCEMVIDRSRQTGVCFAGVHNNSPFALAGSHAATIARSGCVGVAMCNSRARIAPPGAYEPVFGTNPLAVSFPRPKDEPLTIDFATSEISMAEIRDLLARDLPLPEGVAFDEKGKPTRSPAEALRGAVVPFGGHKGYGLALAIEVLAGPMVGAKAGKTVPGTRGFLIGAWCLPDETEELRLRDGVQRLVQEILDCRTLSGNPPRVPGLASIAQLRLAEDQGLIIEDDLYQQLKTLAEVR